LKKSTLYFPIVLTGSDSGFSSPRYDAVLLHNVQGAIPLLRSVGDRTVPPRHIYDFSYLQYVLRCSYIMRKHISTRLFRRRSCSSTLLYPYLPTAL
jgi:hypothetical protein